MGGLVCSLGLSKPKSSQPPASRSPGCLLPFPGLSAVDRQTSLESAWVSEVTSSKASRPGVSRAGLSSGEGFWVFG